ncbi:hypothetical protein [Rhodanobacter sp. BL-MT-08]
MKSKGGEIARGLNSRTILHVPDNHGNINAHSTDELTLVCKIKDVARIIKRIIAATDDLVGVSKDPESLWVKFGLAVRHSDMATMRLHFPIHRYEPHFDLFMRHVEPFNFKSRMYGEQNCDRDLEECLERIRSEAKTKVFEDLVKNHDKSSMKNYRRFTKYVDALLDTYQKLQVVRVALKYRMPEPEQTLRVARAILKDRTSNPGRINLESLVTFDQMKSEMKLFKEKVDDKYSVSLVGFVYKIEYGLLTSFHADWLLFFNGRPAGTDEITGSEIADMWTEVAGAQRALQWNCRAGKPPHPEDTMLFGDVALGDTRKRGALYRFGARLTKPDYWLRLLPPGGGRRHTFETGNLPKLLAGKECTPLVETDAAVIVPEKAEVATKYKRPTRRQPVSGWVKGRSDLMEPNFAFVSLPEKRVKHPKPPKPVEQIPSTYTTSKGPTRAPTYKFKKPRNTAAVKSASPGST